MENLIPQEWFTDLHGLLLLIITAASMAALIKGADWLVDGASGLAYRMGMPKVIVGATIVSLGTTSPEAAVSVMAAWGGNAGLALGNAVGSIIADSALIFGAGCLLATLPADRFVLNRQGWVQFGAAALLAALCYGAYAWHGDGAVLGRGVGVVLLVLLGLYLAISVRWSRQHPHGEPFQTPNEVAEAALPAPATPQEQQRHGIAFFLGAMVLGLLVVLFASRVLICAVIALAEQIGVPEHVIAATLVAFGTSLPELVVGITAIRKKHPELLVGNVIGADVLNVLFVIGASAGARPLPIPGQFLYLHLPLMLVVLTMFRLFIFRAVNRGHFARWNGIPLLVLYVAYVVLQYVVSR